MPFLLPSIRGRNLGSWCPEMLRKANIQVFSCHFWGFTAILSSWSRTPHGLCLMSHSSPQWGGKCVHGKGGLRTRFSPLTWEEIFFQLLRESYWCLKWLFWLPAAQQHPSFFPLPLWVSLFWCLVFSLFQRKLISIHLWEFSFNMNWNVNVLEKWHRETWAYSLSTEKEKFMTFIVLCFYVSH